MEPQIDPLGRRERAKQDKRRRIVDAARVLFAEYGVTGTTTQQIADLADVAIGTLFRYAATKAELLIMVQNDKFEAAIDDGLIAAAITERTGAPIWEAVLAMIAPVVACIGEQPENGRTYMHELVFGDPSEPHRRQGLGLAIRLESGLASFLARDPDITSADAGTLARVITAIIHLNTTATLFLRASPLEVLADIREQVTAVLPRRLAT